MKKAFYVLLVFMVCAVFLSNAYAQEQTNPSIDCQTQPCTVYFKSGRNLVCDLAWREGDTLFLVVHGKKVAIGYDINSIDLKKSFGNLEIPSGPKWMSQEALLLDIFEKSGLKNFIFKEPLLIIATIFKNEKLFSPDIYNALLQASAGAYEPGKIQKEIISVLGDKLERSSLQEKFAWYKTPLGQKVLDLEKLKTDQADEQAFMMQLEKTPPSKQRLELARRLNAIAGTSRNYSEMVYRMFFSLYSSIYAALPSEKWPGVDKTQQLAEELRSDIINSMEKTLTPNFTLYLYRTLSDEEFSAYVIRCESDFEKTFSKEFFAELNSILAKESEEVGKKAAAILLKSQ